MPDLNLTPEQLGEGKQLLQIMREASGNVRARANAVLDLEAWLLDHAPALLAAAERERIYREALERISGGAPTGEDPGTIHDIGSAVRFAANALAKAAKIGGG